MSFADTASAKAHKHYIEAHKDEHPFPLDGTDWSRLVQMRLERAFHHTECLCDTCKNLLTRLHSSSSPLQHEHTAVPRALAYWFLHDPRLTQVKPLFHTDETTAEHTVRVLSDLDLNIHTLTLKQAEQDWLKQRTKAWIPQGKFWVPDTTEEKEAHPEGPAAAKLIEANMRAKEVVPPNTRLSGSEDR